MTATAAPSLNERQRAYLLAIFTVDQELEAEMRNLPYRPFQPRPSAAERRWLWSTSLTLTLAKET